MNDDQEEVEPVTRYEAVAASAEDGSNQPKAACGCSKTSTVNKKGKDRNNMASKKVTSLIDKLIACQKSPFVEADRKMLEASSEERLGELEEEFRTSGDDEVETGDDTGVITTVETTTPAPASTTVTEPVAAKPLSEEEWLASAPESLRSMHAKYREEDARRRTTLISSLKSAQKVYDEKRLSAMTTDQLEEIAALTKINTSASTNAPTPSYLGRGMPVAPSTPTVTEPPDPYDLAGLAAARQSRSSKTVATN